MPIRPPVVDSMQQPPEDTRTPQQKLLGVARAALAELQDLEAGRGDYKEDPRVRSRKVGSKVSPLIKALKEAVGLNE